MVNWDSFSRTESHPHGGLTGLVCTILCAREDGAWSESEDNRAATGLEPHRKDESLHHQLEESRLSQAENRFLLIQKTYILPLQKTNTQSSDGGRDK